MENMFENAYFGKLYKTKDNTIVRFILKDGDFVLMYIPKCVYSIETTRRYNSNGEFYLGDGEYGHATLDIASEWQEPIDEDELDRLAQESYPSDYSSSLYYDHETDINIELREAYKKGYRKAKEK